MNKIKISLIAITLFSIIGIFQSCNSNTDKNKKTVEKDNNKIGILLVNHGSRSETWRNSLLELEKNVTDAILKDSLIKGITTAFMEYTEPSIATRLKEFDKNGFTDIVIIPIFLTVSPHSFEDIPTIVGLKESPTSMETLKIEKIERYKPNAKIHLTPLLDFTKILQKNILRRVKKLSKNPKNEGLVLIGYGDTEYNTEWENLFENIAKYVKSETGISEYSYGWCGHIVHYDPKKTTEATEKVLLKKEKAIVIPVLVSHDEYFQINIIGKGVEKVKNYKEKVIYNPDAILPDENINNWVINITKEYVTKIKNK